MAKKETTVFLGTGRRKSSIARVRIMPGKAKLEQENEELKNDTKKTYEKTAKDETTDVNKSLNNWPKIDTAKIINPGNGYTYSNKCREGNLYTISNDKKSITIDNTQEVISGFTKNIESACISFLGQGSLDFYVFLYEDGTVGYTTQNDNGKIKEFTNLSGIVKIAAIDYTRKVEDNNETLNLSESTIIAVDNKGNIYDLGLLR